MYPDQWERQGQSVPPVDQQELLELKEMLDQMVRLEYPEHLERLDSLERLELPDNWDHLEGLEHLEKLDLQAKLEQLVYKVCIDHNLMM